jgi:hypothetical protein
VKPKVVVKSKAPLAQFEDAVPRAKLATALESAADTRFQSLHAALAKPDGRATSLVTLCRKLDISWHELVEFYRDFQMQATMLVAMEHAPEVMADVAVDSKSRLEPCPRCDGEGLIADPSASEEDGIHLTKQCVRCDGVGKIRVSGDAAARALLFEAMGLKGQKGPLVAQQINFGSGGLEPLEKTMSVVQRITGGGS